MPDTHGCNLQFSSISSEIVFFRTLKTELRACTYLLRKLALQRQDFCKHLVVWRCCQDIYCHAHLLPLVLKAALLTTCRMKHARFLRATSQSRTQVAEEDTG